MTLSVVIRSKDEADRLRLTLASLSRQTAPAEVVVVDDGSSDHTEAVLAAAGLPLVVVRHAMAKGRSAAANAGARAASGDVLLFLDGDTLADPDLVRRHAEAHAGRPALVGRGEMFHLRCTRFLLDPETATPRPGEVERVWRGCRPRSASACASPAGRSSRTSPPLPAEPSLASIPAPAPAGCKRRSSTPCAIIRTAASSGRRPAAPTSRSRAMPSSGSAASTRRSTSTNTANWR